jgi:hypothetical protein
MQIHCHRLRCSSSIFSVQSMDAYIKKLIQIQNYIQQADQCHEKGLARLYYMRAIELLQELPMEFNQCMLALESVGKQPKEILRI